MKLLEYFPALAREGYMDDPVYNLILTKLNVKNVHIYERTNGLGAVYNTPNPNYIHKKLFCDEWNYYTSLTQNGF